MSMSDIEIEEEMIMGTVTTVLSKYGIEMRFIHKHCLLFVTLWKEVSEHYRNDPSHGLGHLLEVFKNSINMYYAIFNRIDSAVKKFILATIMHDLFSFTSRENHHILAKHLLEEIYNKLELEEPDYLLINFSDSGEVLHNTFVDIDTPIAVSCCMNITTIKNAFSGEDILEVANMVHEHRASKKLGFSSICSEIFNAADKDAPVLDKVVKRIYTCAKVKENKFKSDLNGYKNLESPYGDFTSDVKIKELEALGWPDTMIKTFYHLWEKYSSNGYMFMGTDKNGVYATYYADKIEVFHNEINLIIETPEKMFELLDKDDVEELIFKEIEKNQDKSYIFSNVKDVMDASFIIPGIPERMTRMLFNRIKPVSKNNKGELCFLKDVDPINVAFTFNVNQTIDTNNKLTNYILLDTIYVLHDCYYGLYKGSMEEVFSFLRHYDIDKLKEIIAIEARYMHAHPTGSGVISEVRLYVKDKQC